MGNLPKIFIFVKYFMKQILDITYHMPTNSKFNFFKTKNISSAVSSIII